MKENRPIYIPFAGPAILESPLLNKGTAFSSKERESFNLNGLIPETIETLEEQCARATNQLNSYETNLQKYIYLRNLQDINETLFFRVIESNIEAVMPIIYTPTVGRACEQYSKNYRKNRGLFISYPNKDKIDDILNNANRPNIKVIVITDGERILGLGDLGIGGMGIPIGKLALYTSCGGISPAYTLPVTLDCGTNNEALLSDNLYMGWKSKRIAGEEYYNFVDKFIQSAISKWPEALIQFEDFSIQNAMPLLEKYKDKICCFNDDIQGTAAVTLGTIIAATKKKQEKLIDQKIVFLGAGSAGVGIANCIIQNMMKEGLTEQEAHERIFLLDKKGLLNESGDSNHEFQKKFRHKIEYIESLGLDKNKLDLKEIISKTKATILIGVSGASGAFDEEVIKMMAQNTKQPIIMPLSNPTDKAEAVPEDIIKITDGNAIVATGSPFEPVTHKGKTHNIAQCNNSYIFPGIGLGIITVKASKVTEEILMTASEALADSSPSINDPNGNLLPSLSEINQLSKKIAVAVAVKAVEQGLAPQQTEEQIKQKIEKNFWKPKYRNYVRSAF